MLVDVVLQRLGLLQFVNLLLLLLPLQRGRLLGEADHPFTVHSFALLFFKIYNCVLKLVVRSVNICEILIEPHLLEDLVGDQHVLLLWLRFCLIGVPLLHFEFTLLIIYLNYLRMDVNYN